MKKFDKAPSEMKSEILTAVLIHVPFDGWSEVAMAAAAKDLDLPVEFVKMAWPGGAAEMVEAHLIDIDDEMLKIIKTKGFDKMGMTKRIVTAIEVRLEINEQYKEVVRRTVGFLALPLNAPLLS